MRILQVAKSSLPPGGQSHVVHHLSDALARRGHQVTLLALRKRPKDRVSLLSSRSRAYTARLLRLPRTRGLFHDAIFTRELRRLASSGRFDVVHAHMLHPEGTCALRALRGLGIPLVVTGHGEDIQVDPSCGYGIRLDPRVDRRVRRVLASADALIAIGEAMKKEMAAAGADPARVSVIHNGVHVARGRRRETARAGGYILSVGRLVRKKGYDLLLEAMASGLPVAAFRIDGIPEIVEDGVTGLLASPVDAGALAGVLLRLSGDAGMRETMSGAAREAAHPYRWEAVAERHERLYERVLARAGRNVRPVAASDPPRVA